MQPFAAPHSPFEIPMLPVHAGEAAPGRPHQSAFESLVQAVEEHVRGESAALGEYESLATATHDPAIALIMRLILEDEKRHHGLLDRIASTLRDALYWTRSEDALPIASGPWTGVPPHLVNRVRKLIEEEQAGARVLRDLAVRERDIDGGLHSVLLETMALDSDKHARLLQFVEQRLARHARA